MPSIFSALAVAVVALAVTVALASAERIPVVIDVSIGDDFSASVSMSYVLTRLDKFDVKMILTATHNTRGRAKLVAQYLTAFNLQSQVPIGIGANPNNSTYVGPLEGWTVPNMGWSTLDDYCNNKSHAPCYADGVAQLAHVIDENYNRNLHILFIAPMTNWLALVTRFPNVTAKLSNIYSIAMMGGDYKCGGGSVGDRLLRNVVGSTGCKEYNVINCVAGAQMWLNSSLLRWQVPIDVSNKDDTVISGDIWASFVSYARRDDSDGNPRHPWARAVMSSYEYWCPRSSWTGHDPKKTSSPLYDVPAAYVLMENLWPRQLLWKTIQLQVTNSGETVVITDGAQGAYPVRAALKWRNGQSSRETFFNSVVDNLAYPYTPWQQGKK